MTVTDVITEFGAYYLNSGQNLKDLVQKVYFKAETDMLFTQITTEDTVIRRASSTMTRLLQPFQKTFTPTGALTFSPKTISLHKMKMDHEEYPDELEETWLGFLASENTDRKTWPFVKWLITMKIIPQVEEDYEVNEVFSGVYAAPTPGTAGAAGTAMTGIKKQINDAITAGDITTINTGALSTDPKTFCEQIENFCAGIDERYRFAPMNIAMSKSLEVRYRQGKRVKYNTYYDQDNDLSKVSDYNKVVVGLRSHAGSSKIWATPKENAILGIKRAPAQKAVQLEGIDRKVKIYSDFYKGLGFLIDSLVYTNDQDLT